MALHKNLTTGDIHLPYQWSYADTAAREGASGFVAGDVGKFARQLDDNSIWILTATTPTWSITIPPATTSTPGSLSAIDKAKIDTLAQGTVSMSVCNETGDTIPIAKLVAVVGWSTTYARLSVALADKDDPALRPAVGVTVAAVPNGTVADVLVTGELTGIDTTAWGLTDQLVLGSAGCMIRPPPDTDPFTGEVQAVGSTTRIHATEGRVLVVLDGMLPVTGQQIFALVGTSGTPSKTNKYVTDSDSRNTNARAPTSHASSHHSGGADALAHQSIAGSGTNTHSQIDTHLGSTSNPHTVTKSQVSLGNVTNDAQLKRAASDFTTFTEKTVLATGDVLLIEDSAAAYAKKKVQVGAIPGLPSMLVQGSAENASYTTSNTFIQKLRITTGALPAGVYRVGWYYEWNKDGLTDIDVRVQINDITTLMNAFEEAGDGGSDQWYPASGFCYYSGSGVLNIDMDYRSPPSDTAGIRRARLEIWRVS